MRRLAVLAALALVTACGPAARPAAQGAGRAQPAEPSGQRPYQVGKASWYGAFHHGKKTASGERFDKNALTAAHRKLRFGTRVRVTHRNTGRSVVVRINDRGPFGGRGRIIDVSEAAAKRLGMIDSGVAPVRLDIVSWPEE